jgi:hypothetical protein
MYQLWRWDAGWYQIKFGLFGKDVKFQLTPEMIELREHFISKYKQLGDELRPGLYQFKILHHSD